jgi:pimeloyl-ACP methyl ester carboxylesterase
MENGNPLDDPRAASAVFFPRPDHPWGPAASAARDHLFEVEPGVRLRLRLFPGPVDAPALLFFHGNGETARDYDGLADEYRALPATFAVAEYRGYGPSTGRPSLGTFLGDAHHTLDELKALLAAEKRSERVVIMGRSLGSAPAIELAASRPADISALVVESGFARVVPLLELIGVPAGRLGITEKHGPQSEAKMARISMPTLILHAEDDEIIPIGDAELLAAASADPGIVFFRVPRAGHNDIQHRAGPAYFERIRELLARLPR